MELFTHTKITGSPHRANSFSWQLTTKGNPAYASYIGARVAQRFETDWGVGVVCCRITADPHRKSMTRTSASNAIYPTKSQPFSIIWEDNTDSVVDLRRLQLYMRNFEQGLHKAHISAPPPDVQRSPRHRHGGIPRSCLPALLCPFAPTGSRIPSPGRLRRFGKSGTGRWHL